MSLAPPNEGRSPQSCTAYSDPEVPKPGNVVRTCFRMDRHHVQSNVADADLLRETQEHPEEHRDLIVRVAGYTDYFFDLSRELQDEIIARMPQGMA